MTDLESPVVLLMEKMGRHEAIKLPAYLRWLWIVLLAVSMPSVQVMLGMLPSPIKLMAMCV